ncbi:hypothetical protein GMES_3585 [Paraglaciecola mesophila KMM 241]|uniref:Uncharacterized protein n=1 Tax=Paraglaciecola mesophila KMM 241 TaxID=1128912 RepID=K6Z670_9ALTE|nr:hypothetical protein GMES_3585 [Paraglaciecola mesophila KMM 241]
MEDCSQDNFFISLVSYQTRSWPLYGNILTGIVLKHSIF